MTRKVIPFMVLMQEVYFIFNIKIPENEVFCKVFKDNQIFISVVEYKKLSPRTKHIAIKYHYLGTFLQKKIIRILFIDI